MERIYKIIKDNKLLLDIFNVVLGVIVIAFIVLLFINPDNEYFLGGAFGVSGLMNITNGLRQIKVKHKKSMGQSLIMIGIVTFIVGVLFVIL